MTAKDFSTNSRKDFLMAYAVFEIFGFPVGGGPSDPPLGKIRVKSASILKLPRINDIPETQHIEYYYYVSEF